METETVERTKMDGPQVGDVLVSTWGYDQTNVDFWRVVGLTASGKSVRIIPVAQRVVDYSQGSERVVPVDPDEDWSAEPTTSLIRWYDFDGEREWCVGVPVGHRNTAHRWGGRPVYQTAWGWGH
jgi:hypothetical protein